MVNFNSEAVACWDSISSLFVSNCAPCFTTFDAMGTVVASFPTTRLANRRWKIRLDDQFRLLRLKRNTPEHSVIDMLLEPTAIIIGAEGLP